MVRPRVLAQSRLYPNVPAVDAAGTYNMVSAIRPHLAVPGRPLVDRGDGPHRRERNSRALVPSRTNRVILDFFGPPVPREDNGPLVKSRISVCPFKGCCCMFQKEVRRSYVKFSIVSAVLWLA